MVVSGNASDARLSHEAANAGRAVTHARAHIALFVVGIFILASKFRSVYTLIPASFGQGYFSNREALEPSRRRAPIGEMVHFRIGNDPVGEAVQVR
jgi:hypothetical protein